MIYLAPNPFALQSPLAVSIPVALNITGIGRTKFYELVNNGTIESVKIGRRRLINYASLERLAGNTSERSLGQEGNQHPTRGAGQKNGPPSLQGYP
jgi:excisionase family DNA binding protein